MIGSVSFHMFTKKSPLCETLDYQIEETSKNIFDDIVDGHIAGSAALKPARWGSFNDSKVKELVIDGRSVESGCYWDYGWPQVIMDSDANEPSCDVLCPPLLKDSTFNRRPKGLLDWLGSGPR